MTSTAELTLAAQLEQAGIPFEREYRFGERRWRFDFVVARGGSRGYPVGRIAVEIEGGSYTGGHKRGKAYESDVDKHNEAVRLGWKVYRFTSAHVEDGRAIAVIQQALGLSKKEADSAA
jgi:very-short-patch-repair endonuclease